MAGMEFAAIAKSERDRAIRTLVSAFEDDPVERWLYPDDAEYQVHFPAFIAAFGGDAFRDQTVWRLGDFDAVALWFGPDAGRTARLWCEYWLRPPLMPCTPVRSQPWSRWPRAPTEPHWYLPWFGVERTLHGKGWARICCATAWKSWTQEGFRLTWRHPTHGRFRSTSALDSRSPGSPKPGDPADHTDATRRSLDQRTGWLQLAAQGRRSDASSRHEDVIHRAHDPARAVASTCARDLESRDERTGGKKSPTTH